MKILITGGNGLMGNAFRALAKTSPHEFTFITKDMYDLTYEPNVIEMFIKYDPDYVIHTAAQVGGIGGNLANHGKFFHDNILMNTHLIHHSWVGSIKKLIVFSSVCVFPNDLAVLQEDLMHNGPVYESNFAYGYSKRMVDVMIRAYQSQYGVKNYCAVIPGNICGEGDNYSLTNGHVIPMLIHKLYLAKKNGTSFNVWGDGKSLREFLYSQDVARWILQMLELDTLPDKVIMSGDKEYSIKEVVDKLVKIADFTGPVIWETDKPNGQRCRPSDKSRLKALLSENLKYTDIDTTLKLSYEWFANNYPNVRM